MPNPLISQIVLPVDVSGTITNTTFDIKDAEARQMIEDLGHALYWLGVTTTELSDGSETNPVTIGGESKTATLGALVQYVDFNDQPLEFVWNGSSWQLFGYSNLGALAFKSSATGSYTPSGTVTVTPSQAADTTASVTPISGVGTLPSMTVSNEVLTFNPGTLPTAGSAVTVVTASGAVTATASFSGVASTITVQ